MISNKKDIMDYKQITKQVYEDNTKYFQEIFEEHAFNLVEQDIIDFSTYFKDGKKLLEIGCGTWYHALKFKELLFDVLGIDIAENMVTIAKQRWINAFVCDMEDMDFPADSFDGVWAYTSFLHIKKSDIENVLKKVFELLKSSGMIWISLKMGEWEWFLEKDAKLDKNQNKRWFTYYTDQEVRTIFGKYFEIVDFKQRVNWKTIFLVYVMRSKK